MPQPCNLDGISMNIQEENSARYFRVQSEHEHTLVPNQFSCWKRKKKRKKRKLKKRPERRKKKKAREEEKKTKEEARKRKAEERAAMRAEQTEKRKTTTKKMKITNIASPTKVYPKRRELQGGAAYQEISKEDMRCVCFGLWNDDMDEETGCLMPGHEWMCHVKFGPV